MFTCSDCTTGFRVDFYTGAARNPTHCPACGSANVRSEHDKTDEERKREYDALTGRVSRELHGKTK